jgi:hypothetical protein
LALTEHLEQLDQALHLPGPHSSRRRAFLFSEGLTMTCFIRRLISAARHVLRRARDAVSDLVSRAKALWATHLRKVAENPAYAASTAAVVAAVVGALPVRESALTVLAAFLGLSGIGFPRRQYSSSHYDPEFG